MTWRPRLATKQTIIPSTASLASRS